MGRANLGRPLITHSTVSASSHGAGRRPPPRPRRTNRSGRRHARHPRPEKKRASRRSSQSRGFPSCRISLYLPAHFVESTALGKCSTWVAADCNGDATHLGGKGRASEELSRGRPEQGDEKRGLDDELIILNPKDGRSSYRRTLPYHRVSRALSQPIGSTMAC